eukprot:scaffold1736_cov127-Cylindrotheca_fusiformis.AAC.114
MIVKPIWLLAAAHIVLLVFIPETCSFFLHTTSPQRRSKASTTPLQLSASLNKWEEERKISELVDALFAESPEMVQIHLQGQGRLKLLSNRTRAASEQKQIVLFLSAVEKPEQAVSSLVLPLEDLGQLKLLSFAAARRPLSKSVLLSLNSLLVNRDGALFDNIPWSSWSVDPQKRNRDAADNAILEKFHLGKRDAYYRFMGKDWQGRSVAIGNLALRLKYMLEPDEQEDSKVDDEENSRVLAVRVLQLQIRECQMEVAGIESQLALGMSGKEDDLTKLRNQKNTMQRKIQTMEKDIRTLTSKPETMQSLVSDVLEKVAQWSTKDGENEAPYRGAMGYSPMLDSKDDLEAGRLPYTSPFDLLNEILEDQLNARVIGCVLENSSLLKGNIVLGGAVVLQRRTPTKTKSIMGEEVEFQDYDEDFGNVDVKGGDFMIVECDSDEAIGVSLACGVPLRIDSSLYATCSIQSEAQMMEKEPSRHIMDTLPIWKTIDSETSLQVEGERQMTNSASPIAMPGSFDDIPSESTALFPVDSPIKSVDEYDELSNEDKAKTLLEMSNFSGRLPRPRVVKQSKSNPLDDLLLPLIDESVRRQILIRDAEREGDMELANELRSRKSRRQVAMEMAAAARNSGNDDLADSYESESDFLKSLRADSTQDEGEYNRFLDRDDWYERDRQATAKRIRKSSFGTLLDGIE